MTTTPSTHLTAVERFFSHNVKEFQSQLNQIEADAQRLDPLESQDLLDRFTEAFHQSRADCRDLEAQLGDDSRLIAECQRRFRQELAPWFDQSWFFDRAKKKPRGYPGDYLMLTALYDEQVKSETGLGIVMDRYFLQADLARAVRTRLAAVKQFLIDEFQKRSEPVRVLNVASGPGREFSSGFERLPVPVTMTCLDTDQDALDYLASHVGNDVARQIDFHCVCYNALKTTSGEKNIKSFGHSDIIYSVGLCDYIPDRYMIRILEGWRNSVRENGVVYVAFKDSRCYAAAEYQWHADWHFYQRTEEDCRQLFAQAGYDMEQLQMTRDESGIIMNFVCRLRQSHPADSAFVEPPQIESLRDSVDSWQAMES